MHTFTRALTHPHTNTLTHVPALLSTLSALSTLAVILLPNALHAQGAPNLLRNGDFHGGANANGAPADWAPAGDATVEQALILDRDPERGPCAKLTCTRITGSSGASHSMIEQSGTFEIQAGQWYGISFWARQQDIEGGALSIGVSETKTWQDTGIREGFRAGRAWKQFRFQVRAARTVPMTDTRFQIWHHSTGVLWLSDVVLEKQDAPTNTYSPLIAVEGRTNLIPNSSFECGTAGWGGITRLSGWAGNLDSLPGTLDAGTGTHSSHSLKIVVDPRTDPVYSFDYFQMQQVPIRMPLAATIGWIPVQQGEEYTLSAWMKSDQDGTPAVLAFYFSDDPTLKTIILTRQWQRYSFTLRAPSGHCFIALGPDLREKPDARATAWIDAVQLEKGSQPTTYQPADLLEVGLELKDGPLLKLGTQPELMASAYNQGDAPATAHATIKLKDFFDQAAGEATCTITLTAHSAGSLRIPLPISTTQKGFYHLDAHVDSGVRTRDTSLRLAVIQPYQEKDSIWGINHAYPWNTLLQQAHDIGLTWTRDWSLKWQAVEPEKGKFTFTEADTQINRPLALGDNMLLLLPFPSSDWASTSPEQVTAKSGYPSNRERMAWMPREPADFGAYVRACVEHYRDRTRYWEILNESLYTDYSLPASKGFTVKDYVTLLKEAYQAAKADDPHSFVVGGVAASGGGLYPQLFQAGALDFMDALNIHTYPGLAPPETTEHWLEDLETGMKAAGKPRPIWLTEYGYYADDEPSIQPIRFEMPLVESEKLCAAYLVRINTIMLAHHVEKLFYHAGVSSPLNHEGLEGIFFRYGGAPRKMLIAQSAMANLFPPQTRFITRLNTPVGLRAYLFRNPTGPLLVAWAEDGYEGGITMQSQQLQPIDIQGNTINTRSVRLTEYPIYIQAPGLTPTQLQNSLRIEPGRPGFAPAP